MGVEELSELNKEGKGETGTEVPMTVGVASSIGVSRFAAVRSGGNGEAMVNGEKFDLF